MSDPHPIDLLHRGPVAIDGDRVWTASGARLQSRRNAITGSRVEVLVVPVRGVPPDATTRQSVMAHCRQGLPRHAVPALLEFVDEIDAGSSGKMPRS